MTESTESFDPDERRHEAMMDGSGFSNYAADRRLDDESLPGSVEPPRFASPKHKPHRTGHVRDFESDRDYDLAAARAEYKPLTDEDRAIAREALAGLQSFRDKLEIENAIRQNEEAFSDPDPYDREKYLAAKERDLNARMRKIHDKRAARAH